MLMVPYIIKQRNKKRNYTLSIKSSLKSHPVWVTLHKTEEESAG